MQVLESNIDLGRLHWFCSKFENDNGKGELLLLSYFHGGELIYADFGF